MTKLRRNVLYIFLFSAGPLIVNDSNLKSGILKMRIKLADGIVEKIGCNSEVIKGYPVVMKKGEF